MTAKIIHKELSYLVNGCIFDVHNEVGPGLREECYQKAIEQRLIEKGIPFVAKRATRRELVYRGHAVDVFEPDLIVADESFWNSSINRKASLRRTSHNCSAISSTGRCSLDYW